MNPFFYQRWSLWKLFCFVLCSQVLFNQFKYFYNLYFLLLACSQFIKELRLGALYTYWVPLVRVRPVCGSLSRLTVAA